MQSNEPAPRERLSLRMRLLVLALAILAASGLAVFLAVFNGLPGAGGITGNKSANRSGNNGSSISAAPGFDLPVGERLEYAIMWKGAHAGDIVFTVNEKKILRQREVFPVSMSATSRGLLSAAYAIHDQVKSMIDARTGNSLQFSRKIREGTWKLYHADDRVDFDYQTMTAVYTKTKYDKNGKSRTRTYAPRTIPGPLQDSLSLFYSLRNPVPCPGQERELFIGGRKRTDAVMVKAEASEDISIKGLGTFRALKITFRPRKTAGLKAKVELFMKQGELVLWLDRLHGIPLKLEIRGIPVIGSVQAILRAARNTGLRTRNDE